MSEDDVLKAHMEHIREDIKEIKQKLDANYVTRTEFEPIKRIVYGLVMAVLGCVVVAVVKGVSF